MGAALVHSSSGESEEEEEGAGESSKDFVSAGQGYLRVVGCCFFTPFLKLRGSGIILYKQCICRNNGL